MRSLVVVAALGGVADADVHPRLTWVVSEVGAGHVDHTSGMAVGGAWELGVATKRTAAGVEVGLAGVCAWSNSQNCEGPFDFTLAAHLWRRIGARKLHSLWLGGGPTAHRIESSSATVAARGELARDRNTRWEPGVDAQLRVELRDEDWIGAHLGLRAFALRSDELPVMKLSSSSPPPRYGIDGGVVFEVGVIYGR